MQTIEIMTIFEKKSFALPRRLAGKQNFRLYLPPQTWYS